VFLRRYFTHSSETLAALPTPTKTSFDWIIIDVESMRRDLLREFNFLELRELPVSESMSELQT
jgi:hypothetical protein